MTWSPLPYMVSFDLGVFQTASRSTWAMRSRDLFDQEATRHMPEPRQLMPRPVVVRGKRLVTATRALKNVVLCILRMEN